MNCVNPQKTSTEPRVAAIRRAGSHMPATTMQCMSGTVTVTMIILTGPNSINGISFLETSESFTFVSLSPGSDITWHSTWAIMQEGVNYEKT